MRTDKGWRRFYASGWLVSGVLGVIAMHRWRVYVREVEQRADEAERTREVVARERAMEERVRIARDLHDSLTHSMSVIKMQSAVAVHLARKRGVEAAADVDCSQLATLTFAIRAQLRPFEIERRGL